MNDALNVHRITPELLLILTKPTHFRLQDEIERLNREIVDIRRQKKEDEEALIREWKEKIERKDNELNEEIERLKTNHR